MALENALDVLKEMGFSDEWNGTMCPTCRRTTLMCDGDSVCAGSKARRAIRALVEATPCAGRFVVEVVEAFINNP